jgi:hypothetical protein
MKKYILLTTTLFMIMGLSTACASSHTWLDDGATVHGSDDNSSNQVKSKSLNIANNNELKVTLSTGAKVTLTGGVYVKAKEAKVILDWAQANGYTATKDKYIKNAVHIECITSKSIEVANLVAKLEGVTTSAPKYKKNLVTK